jgi:hypothetical protein
MHCSKKGPLFDHSQVDVGLGCAHVGFTPKSGHRFRRKIRPPIVKRSRVQIAPSATTGPGRRMQ